MKLSDHCYGITGLAAESPWAVNGGFVVGKHTTLIVDTGSNQLSAQTIFGYCQCAKSDNTLIVVNTEPHFDHIGGNCFFRERGIDVLAHPGIARSQADFDQNKKEFNDSIPHRGRKAACEAEAFFHRTVLANPNSSLAPDEEIDLGDVTVRVVYTPGHTAMNISLLVEPDNILFCGDCIVKSYVPNLEAGNTEAWQTWVNSLCIIEKLNPAAIIPGHGDILIGEKEVGEEIKRMKTIIATAIAESKPPTAL